MAGYAVEFTTGAAKEIRKLDAGVRRRILSSVAALAEDPRPAGCKKLVGEQNAWRVRIADYRVLYEIHDEVLTVTVARVAHRLEVYKK
ncbi:type II toxin-antitoxin system RelE/ParE family toxin [Pseudarthrobacter sp. BIM B-2242]|uniref:type II toxin-antitoxin system RelE family toxin n=1 Tax=Pseudarthrobacter sp. BIM B-2242 TaxID=2772401 RepID=UPI00168AB0AB|nr:type II toxin-antitoxin system RelE/ParE family toxin [Pseudarthrobacter sp. BIM B-2242]QOD02665.1 type II toxin-antitoxin system RelE/ParE family toxin [Pseudarthrobacter sp. BIM B-2242]